MVTFDIQEGHAKVMEDGPWMIFDHYLTIQNSGKEQKKGKDISSQSKDVF